MCSSSFIAALRKLTGLWRSVTSLSSSNLQWYVRTSHYLQDFRDELILFLEMFITNPSLCSLDFLEFCIFAYFFSLRFAVSFLAAQPVSSSCYGYQTSNRFLKETLPKVTEHPSDTYLRVNAWKSKSEISWKKKNQKHGFFFYLSFYFPKNLKYIHFFKKLTFVLTRQLSVVKTQVHDHLTEYIGISSRLSLKGVTQPTFHMLLCHPVS